LAPGAILAQSVHTAFRFNKDHPELTNSWIAARLRAAANRIFRPPKNAAARLISRNCQPFGTHIWGKKWTPACAPKINYFNVLAGI